MKTVIIHLLILLLISNVALSQNNFLTVKANQNLAIDSLGRVIDITFNRDTALNAPWDRFRFTISQVQPFARDGGAFLGDLNNDSINDLFIAGFDGNLNFYPGIKGNYNCFGNGSILKFYTSDIKFNPYNKIGSGDWIQGDVADLDGDKKNEIIINGKIFKNIGTSEEPILKDEYNFNTSWDPAATIGDLNNDGKPDIVICQSYTQPTNIYWNNSTPGLFNFTTEFLTIWPNNSASTNHVSLADLNGDSLLDLAGPAGIYFNTGTAQIPHFNFTNPAAWNKSGGISWNAGSDRPPHIYLKDVNNDGLTDAYVSNSQLLWQVLYYQNIGTSTSPKFKYMGPIVVSSTPLNVCYRGKTSPDFSPKRGFVATADIDNNGYEDILLSTSGGDSFGSPTILWNFPNTTDSTKTTLTYQDLYTYPSLYKISPLCDYPSSPYCDCLVNPSNLFSAWSDFSGDGLQDAIEVDQWMDKYSLYLCKREGTWPYTLKSGIGWNPIHTIPSGKQAVCWGIALVDIDLDGNKDIVGGTEGGSLVFYRNLAKDGTLSLADPVYLSDLDNKPIDVGTQSWPTAIDLDGDGDMDFLVSNKDGLIYKVICVSLGQTKGYKMDGLLGSIEQNPIDVTNVVGGGTITPSLATIDINKDGLKDVVMADYSGSVWLLQNVGTKSEARFSLKPLTISQTNSANLEKINNRHYRLYFSLPTIANETELAFNYVSNDSSISTAIVITPPPPIIIGTTDGSRCGTGTVTLGAKASAGTINWYASSTGGSSLGTGTSFTTPSLSSTTVYYVDATDNGSTTFTRTAVTAKDTCTTGKNSILSTDKIKVYPNPTTGMVEISINETIDSDYTIELFNNLGALKQKITIDKTVKVTQIDLSGYPAGLYLMRFDTKKGFFDYKILKE